MTTLRERIAGSWKLVSWTRLVDGVEDYGMLGADPLGLILYAPDGRVFASLMRRQRSNFATDDLAATSVEERAAAYEGYVGYCGRYTVNEAGGSVAHHIELSSYPNWTGTVQTRFVENIGERMKLSTPPSLRGGKAAAVILTWVRAD
jgi:hypothetical protein